MYIFCFIVFCVLLCRNSLFFRFFTYLGLFVKVSVDSHIYIRALFELGSDFFHNGRLNPTFTKMSDQRGVLWPNNSHDDKSNQCEATCSQQHEDPQRGKEYKQILESLMATSTLRLLGNKESPRNVLSVLN